jgi:3',5'-cyclic AMP phosphodiesterase CpdA
MEMRRPLLLGSLICAALLGPLAYAQAGNPVHSAGAPYAASVLPDRIVLTPGANPARQMAVAFRTATDQADALLEFGPALAGPSLSAGARAVTGTTQRLDTENGSANYHHVMLDSLEPDTPYVYRVKGSAGWSEWHQFRTPQEQFAPFKFIYLGDTQNDILAIASRTIRQALRSIAHPALVLHAGDLVAQGEALVHDDEWGEWNQAGGYAYASIPQLTAAGNHEYLDHMLPNGEESRRLGPHFALQFALPHNGADGVAETSYFTDFQGVRFVVLDGTSALDLGTLESQTQWLERTLRESSAHWKVVVMHQPMFTCARPSDTPKIKEAWKPILERYRVDLVLQGHDHCYSRLTNEAGRKASAKAREANEPVGPVYMVSVAGSKMYGLNGRAQRQPDRVAEDTQLYQTIAVEQDRMEIRAYTVDGRLYDAFDIQRTPQGHNTVREISGAAVEERVCTGDIGPDNLPCTARDK